MSMKDSFERWRALWAKLTAEVEDEEFEDAAKVICDRCGGRATADCAACPVRTGRPLRLQMDPDTALALMRGMTPMKALNAAIEDLKYYSECCQCAHEIPDDHPDCEACDYTCWECLNHSCPCHDCRDGNKWVWRGPRRTPLEEHDVG